MTNKIDIIFKIRSDSGPNIRIRIRYDYIHISKHIPRSNINKLYISKYL